MNIVKVTNKIALITVFLLIYWVFIFVVNTVFNFKVLKENLTEIFLMSIFGIFSILFGAIILNIMYNLTAIAERSPRDTAESGPGSDGDSDRKGSGKLPIVLFVASLAAITFFLYYADLRTSQKKEEFLVSSAEIVLEDQSDIVERLSDYSFSKEYIENANEDITVLSKIEEKYPNVTVIVRDQIQSNSVLLGFNGRSSVPDNEEPKKSRFILSTSSEERDYLNSIFDGAGEEHRFASQNGRYEIYYPAKTDKGTIVIHMSQRSRYGKIGS